jgi:glucose uptake protein
MVLITNYALAVSLCFLAMICWGSWQNTRNLAGLQWRFELYYWDFVTGILLFSLIAAFTFGSMGSEGRSFLADLSQAKSSGILSAMLGGALWNLGTLLLTAAIAVAGMSVAFPIGGGIGWVLGILINYIAQPSGNPVSLSIGSGIIVVAILLSMFSYKRLANQQKKPTLGAIILSITAGILIANFYRFVAASLTPDFTISDGKLTPYTAVVFFSVGAFISTFIYNPFFMRRPVSGSPVTFRDYLQGGMNKHLLGMLGGAIWCLGMTVSFMAVNAASPAISYGLSNSAPIVAALWGILVWKEFKDAPKGTNLMLSLMFLFYLVGLVFIVIAKT